MIYHLQQQLVELFLSDKTDHPDDISAVNVAAMMLRRLPYFGKSYDNHFLADKGDGFYKLYYDFKGDAVNADPLRDTYHDDYHYYDEAGPHPDYFPIHEPQWLTNEAEPMQGEISLAVQDRANAYLARLSELNPLMRLASAPSHEELSARQTIRVSFCDYDAIYSLTRELLGKECPSNLRPEGVMYHSPGEHFGERGRRYFVAHNDHEIVGVCGVIENEHALILTYVSVASGFRRQGVSEKIYAHMIDYASRTQKMINRSTPSGTARDNPAITRKYDRMLSQSPVMHAHCDSTLSDALTEALNTRPYEEVRLLGKPLCEQLMAERNKLDYHSYGGPWTLVDRALSKQVREHWAAEEPLPERRARLSP